MIDDKDRQALALALDTSTYSTFGRVKIGAVVKARLGLFLGRGYNQRRTHPRQYEANKRAGKQIQSPCLHAEVAAILDAERYQQEERWNHAEMHTIYVARLDRNGKFANCKPCAACHSEIVAAGIKRVVYTTEEGVKEYNVTD
jgi:deoxycytidylate deaminase